MVAKIWVETIITVYKSINALLFYYEVKTILTLRHMKYGTMISCRRCVFYTEYMM